MRKTKETLTVRLAPHLEDAMARLEAATGLRSAEIVRLALHAWLRQSGVLPLTRHTHFNRERGDECT